MLCILFHHAHSHSPSMEKKRRHAWLNFTATRNRAKQQHCPSEKYLFVCSSFRRDRRLDCGSSPRTHALLMVDTADGWIYFMCASKDLWPWATLITIRAKQLRQNIYIAIFFGMRKREMTLFAIGISSGWPVDPSSNCSSIFCTTINKSSFDPRMNCT